MKEKTTKTSSFILVLVLMISLFVLFVPKKSKAFYYPFGGKIEEIKKICTCQYFPGMIIKVGEPRGGEFLYALYATMPYKHYNFTTGKKVLGLAVAWAPCMQTAGKACTQDGGAPLILKIGSSK